MTTPSPAAAAASALYVDAHTHSKHHRSELTGSEICACFFCFKKFAPTAIKAWTDTNETALCPGCGVDAVIGSGSGHRLDDGFLRKMHQHYFAYRSK